MGYQYDSLELPALPVIGIDTLERRLVEVKALYRQKYGEDADSEDEQEQEIVDKDGTPWLLTVGRGSEQQREAYEARVESLGDRFAEVKALYWQQYGEDADSEEEQEQ